MRIELILVLWAAGFGTLGWALLEAGRQRPDPASFIQRPGPSFDRQFVVTEATSSGGAAALPTEAPEIDDGSHRLFRIRSAAIAAPLQAMAPPLPTIEPVLRGIIVSDGAPGAIFALDGQDPQYRVVKVGESVAGYAIDAIGTDTVTSTTLDGSTRTFELRGRGEGH